jgi:hypothetical protein
VSPKSKLPRTLALALAGGSLAIGVPAALAAGGADPVAPAGRLVQDEPQRGDGQNRPDHDCPERDGAGNSDAGTPEV